MGGGLRSWLRGLGVLAEIRRRRYDVAISLRRDADERLFLSLCGARWRVGYDRGRARRLLSLRIRSDPSGHVVERHLDMARALGCPTDGCRPRVVIRPGDRATARGLLQAIGGSRGARCVALAPGAGYATKLWGAREWAELAERATFQWGATVLILGGPGDREVARGIRERTAAPLWDLVGETSLPVAAAVLEGVDLLITVDSALMHIAAALEVPLVAVFGPTLAREWGPWGPPDRCRVIEADVPCRECLRRWCPTHECMRSLTPARVAEAAEGLLHHWSRREGARV